MSLVLLLAVSGVVVVAVAGLVLARCVHRVEPGHALIVNRAGGDTIVSFDRSLVVLPVLHHAETMDVSLKKLVIARQGRTALICRDNIRADVVATFFVRINNTTDDVLRVARSIGVRRAGNTGTLDELFDAKFSEAMKTVARQMQFAELHDAREMYRDQVLAVIGNDLNGFVLDDLAIDDLEMTPIEVLDPNNVLDAAGLRKIEELTRTGALPSGRGGAPRSRGDRWVEELRRLGLLDVCIGIEVACDIARARPALSLEIEGVSDAVTAALPGVSSSIIDEAGRGELTCGEGRARFRWRDSAVTDSQLVAGARLVHALREDPSAYR